MYKIILQEELKIRAKYDVVVCGGGVSGVAAAVSAARHGKKTLLLEKSNWLGGLATIGLVNLWEPIDNGRGKQIIFGMAEEIMRLAPRTGFNCMPEIWENGEPDKPTNIRAQFRFSAPVFALELNNWVVNSGVDLLFDALCTRPVMDGKHCRGVVIETKSGREFVEAGVVIDTTGDADILYRAGVPTVQGKNYYTYYAEMIDFNRCELALKSGRISDLYGRIVPGKANLYGKNQPSDIPFFSGTDAEDVTRYISGFQRELLKMLADIPEQNRRDIPYMPQMPQLRTTRRIDGDYVMDESDMYRHFDDSVGTICDFDHRDCLYEVPFRAMTRRGYDNLIGAGRIVGGKGYIWDVLRVIPPAIMTGEVAGIATALALNSGRPIAEIDITELQKIIAEAGPVIHFDDALVPEKMDENGVRIEENSPDNDETIACEHI